jgi:hypothetical protein
MSRPMSASRIMGHFSLFASLLSLGLAAYLMSSVSGEKVFAANLHIEPPVTALGEVCRGTRTAVSFVATNSSPNAITLIGVNAVCLRWGCVGPATRFPISVPPHSTAEFTLDLSASTGSYSGEFSTEIALYSDSPRDKQTNLRLTGRIVPSLPAVSQ